jgi:pyruvate ferredoxin oxidoreductase alpha subunit
MVPMTMEVLEGSRAVSETVALCKPDVISAYPITPQTHIVEDLAKLVADGKLKSKFLEVESEFSAMSSVVGAVAAGSRVFTATSSQGLALMHEVLFATSGLRLPVVMVVANRALSAPINIWNDHSDTMAERDSGWIQLYTEDVQETVDTLIQAYKIAERVLLPVMVCMDGFILTHVIEPVDIPDQKDVDEFLPRYNPDHAVLDTERPMTLGPFAYPEPYFDLRKELEEAIQNSKDVISEVNEEFVKKFKRKYGNGFIEEYKNDKDTAIVAMGSVCGTIKEVVDKRKDVGLVRIKCFRPFPKEELTNALKGKKTIIVLEKAVAHGLDSGPLFIEIRNVLYPFTEKPKFIGVIAGLGGVDIRISQINDVIDKSKQMKDGEVIWMKS